jgi:hypothetical protein
MAQLVTGRKTALRRSRPRAVRRQLGHGSAHPHDGRTAKHHHHESPYPLKQRGTGRGLMRADSGWNKVLHEFHYALKVRSLLARPLGG